MTVADGGSRRTLLFSALIAGALGLGLVAVGWWLRDWEWNTDRWRFLDPSWLGGVVITGLGHLAIGRTGFKIGLLVLGAAAGGVVWLRQRRGSGAESDQDPPSGG
ncbi:hypothetical protein GA0070616_4561 [Micromonospora nigra]|uniref:Uncharacterized protein n=1 Tax=Micromonospora nigra TaxID=145857 RepID=A0A1C6STL4_9ACTN|nr:hypothetical protein [Micromonospora nigra]SCL32817.1 hypothetical protein GA0070616_4561 [Micromonospora nigra]